MNDTTYIIFVSLALVMLTVVGGSATSPAPSWAGSWLAPLSRR